MRVYRMAFDLILRENGFGSDVMKPGMITAPIHPRTARCSHEMTSYDGKPAQIDPLSHPETAGLKPTGCKRGSILGAMPGGPPKRHSLKSPARCAQEAPLTYMATALPERA